MDGSDSVKGLLMESAHGGAIVPKPHEPSFSRIITQTGAQLASQANNMSQANDPKAKLWKLKFQT